MRGSKGGRRSRAIGAVPDGAGADAAPLADPRGAPAEPDSAPGSSPPAAARPGPGHGRRRKRGKGNRASSVQAATSGDEPTAPAPMRVASANNATRPPPSAARRVSAPDHRDADRAAWGCNVGDVGKPAGVGGAGIWCASGESRAGSTVSRTWGRVRAASGRDVEAASEDAGNAPGTGADPAGPEPTETPIAPAGSERGAAAETTPADAPAVAEEPTDAWTVAAAAPATVTPTPACTGASVPCALAETVSAGTDTVAGGTEATAGVETDGTVTATLVVTGGNATLVVTGGIATVVGTVTVVAIDVVTGGRATVVGTVRVGVGTIVVTAGVDTVVEIPTVGRMFVRPPA